MTKLRKKRQIKTAIYLIIQTEALVHSTKIKSTVTMECFLQSKQTKSVVS